MYHRAAQNKTSFARLPLPRETFICRSIKYTRLLEKNVIPAPPTSTCPPFYSLFLSLLGHLPRVAAHTCYIYILRFHNFSHISHAPSSVSPSLRRLYECSFFVLTIAPLHIRRCAPFFSCESLDFSISGTIMHRVH